MRLHFGRPATWVVLAGIAVVLTLLGPFGTGERLRLLPRAAFWLAHSVASYGIGYVAVPPLHRLFRRHVPPWIATLLAGGVAGLGICISVMAINFAALGYVPPARDVPPLVATVVVIAIIVTQVIEVINREVAPEVSDRAPRQPGLPPLLDRVPLDKRGTLVSISVEDHYVRIRTDRGEALILMRLSDALRETGDVAGLQVHRSHWVALSQVKAARREGDRAILTLHHGPDIPVSRANVAAIREAGLLPRT